MTAEEAVELGFADEIEDAKTVAASIRDGMLIVNGISCDLSYFRNPPKLVVVPAGEETEEKVPLPEGCDPEGGDPEDEEAAKQRKLRLLKLELELLTGSSF